MEVQQQAPQFFAESLFEGLSRYQTPESNVDKTEASSDPLALGIRGLNTPAAATEPGPGGVEWENEAANLGFMADGAEPRIFFETGVTPPEEEDDDEEEEEAAAVAAAAAEREQAPKKRTVIRKTRKNPSTIEEERRRDKFLERNRIAASKCREKKKQYVSGLEEQRTALEAHNQKLQVQCNSLVSEITYLKHRLMQHAKCNDERIDSWIENEARRFVATPPNDMGAQPWAPGFLPGKNNSMSLPTLPNEAFSGGLGQVERQASISYSTANVAAAFPSPTDEIFPSSLQVGLKSEPAPDDGVNYDYMPASLLNAEQPAYGGGQQH